MVEIPKELRWVVFSFVNDIEEKKRLYSSTVVADIKKINQQRIQKELLLDELHGRFWSIFLEEFYNQPFEYPELAHVESTPELYYDSDNGETWYVLSDEQADALFQ